MIGTGDGWHVGDRWWTADPVDRWFLTLLLETDSVKTQAVVSYDLETKEWTIREENDERTVDEGPAEDAGRA